MYIISTNTHYETVIIISIPQKWKLEIREVNNSHTQLVREYVAWNPGLWVLWPWLKWFSSKDTSSSTPQ